uniref:AB hydrolase-1 domain-containing protein n=1 Tax=Phytophthora ramorum TaxID=164328 RepID=H3HCL9_PHYRM
MGVTLLFAHACGFSKEMWEPVMRRLRESEVVQRVETEFVSFDFPYHGTRSDVELAETLKVDARNPKAPWVKGECDDCKSWKKKPTDVLIGVGFSMGSGALWTVEIVNPGTFDALILIEPTLDTNSPMTEAVRSYLVASTLRRPSSWLAFAAWDDEALAAHLSGALVEKADGSVSLACDPRLEASMYSMEALDFSDMELQQPKCPIRFHWCSESTMCFEKMLKAVEAKCPHIYTVREGMKGLGHLVVMENPALTAANIAAELEQLPPFASKIISKANL